MMQAPVAKMLPDGIRMHLQHGPIDLIIGADGDRSSAFSAATERFQTILEELVAELPQLRGQQTGTLRGVVAQQMLQAVGPHRQSGFITPMAAVAGAVADTILGAMVTGADLRRAYVNNGGDIAVWLTGEMQFHTLVSAPDQTELARINLTADAPARGIATSGMPGRSLSRGIADAVTVLARTAAAADVAATMIANAVDLPDCSAITRVPACALDPDSDLGERLVVTQVGDLSKNQVSHALSQGARRAKNLCEQGVIFGAALFLRRQSYVLGPIQTQQNQIRKSAEYA